MVLSRKNEWEVCCDFCNNSTDWATADTKKEANRLLCENGWSIINRKHWCGECDKDALAVVSEQEESE